LISVIKKRAESLLIPSQVCEYVKRKRKVILNQTQKRTTTSPEETRALARELGEGLAPGAVVALYGDLGAGKTCFVQGLAGAYGVHEPVTSPTFTLINEYDGGPRFFHVDLYRVSSPEEAVGFGLEETMNGDGITAIEWAERAETILPPHTLRVRLLHDVAEDVRVVCIEPGVSA